MILRTCQCLVVQVSITTPSGEVKTQECLAGADIVAQVERAVVVGADGHLMGDD